MSLVERAEKEIADEKTEAAVRAIKTILREKESGAEHTKRLDAALERINNGDEETIRDYDRGPEFLGGRKQY